MLKMDQRYSNTISKCNGLFVLNVDYVKEFNPPLQNHLTPLIPKFPAYLGTDTQHLQRGWDVHVLGYLNVAEVDGKGLTPNAEVANVEYCEVTGQG